MGTRLVVLLVFELFPGTIVEEDAGSFSSDVGMRLMVLLLFPEMIVDEEDAIDAEEERDSGAFGVVLAGDIGSGGEEGV